MRVAESKWRGESVGEGDQWKVSTLNFAHTLNLAFQEVSTLNFAFQALTLNFADYGSVKRVTTVTMGNCKSFLDDQ